MKSITKDLIKEYFSDHWDVIFEQLINDLNINENDRNSCQKYLDELVEESWVKKSPYKDSFEYDPGDNYGVWEDASPPDAKAVTDYLNKKK
jgi:hypothetical protein